MSIEKNSGVNSCSEAKRENWTRSRSNENNAATGEVAQRAHGVPPFSTPRTEGPDTGGWEIMK